MIVIVDYKMGNVGSIANMIKKVGGESVITSDKKEINKATKLILPGVGSFDTGMKNLNESGILEILNHCVIERKIPVLGVCLGMQLLTKKSEEGILSGLGWIDAETVKFPNMTANNGKLLRIPHMGWNMANVVKKDEFVDGLYEDSRFYFVHSYYVKCNDERDILMETDYGIKFTSALSKNNIWGTQFHPEKSHKFGMKLYENFVKKI